MSSLASGLLLNSPGLMSNISESIARSLEIGTSSVRAEMGRLTRAARHGADYVENAVAQGARGIRTSGSRFVPAAAVQSNSSSLEGFKSRPLIGRDEKNRKVEFWLPEVRIIPLNGFNGEPIGVSFPSKDMDEVKVPRWAGLPGRIADFRYSLGKRGEHPDYPDLLNEPALLPKWYNPSLVVRDGGWLQPLPHGPRYVQAHADPDGFNIKVKLNPGSPNEWLKVKIDGTTFGNLVATNEHFRRACDYASMHSDIVLLCCRTAESENSAALHAARSIQSHKVFRDIHAFTGYNWIYPQGNFSYVVAEVRTDAEGNRLPPIKTYETSGNRWDNPPTKPWPPSVP